MCTRRIEMKDPEGIVLVLWLKACALESMRSSACFNKGGARGSVLFSKAPGLSRSAKNA
jgi:hypothetical protein